MISNAWRLEADRGGVGSCLENVCKSEGLGWRESPSLELEEEISIISISRGSIFTGAAPAAGEVRFWATLLDECPFTELLISCLSSAMRSISLILGV
jgi:hypothetical protein